MGLDQNKKKKTFSDRIYVTVMGMKSLEGVCCNEAVQKTGSFYVEYSS